jgi:hypothetical protein
MPSDGTVPGDGTMLLADGITAVSVGETLTIAQLTGLEFKADAGRLLAEFEFRLQRVGPDRIDRFG